LAPVRSAWSPRRPETGAYELLTRVARRAGDEETAAVAERILAEDRAAVERVASTWDTAAELALRETVGAGG
jgi:ferritin-like metal-binding protein YciE